MRHLKVFKKMPVTVTEIKEDERLSLSSEKKVKVKNGEVLCKEYPPGTKLSVIMAEHAFLWGERYP